MSRPLLLAALLAAAYFAYTEYAPRSALPTASGPSGFTGSGNAPGKIVGGGASDAAKSLGN